MSWLERILLNAVAKARIQEAKLNRHAKTNADRATRDWWEGIVSFEKVGYDSPPPARRVTSDQSYQQQLDSRIKQSQAAGIELMLPRLFDRYDLSLFERQTMLLAIAPEIHRRYGELCGYLAGSAGLPTVDLALRLFCRDDQAWRQGRSLLLTGALVTEGFLLPMMSSASSAQSFLQQPLKLNPHLVSDLLSDWVGDVDMLAQKLDGYSYSAMTISTVRPIVRGETLLPTKLKTQMTRTTAKLKTIVPSQALIVTGLDRLLIEPDDWSTFYGTIAQKMAMQPEQIDLDSLDLRSILTCWQSSMPIATTIEESDTPKLLVIRSAQLLLSRHGLLSRAEKIKFITQVRSVYKLVLLEMPYPMAIEQVWRSWILDSISLPIDGRKTNVKTNIECD
jgi:hypothetical protein